MKQILCLIIYLLSALNSLQADIVSEVTPSTLSINESCQWSLIQENMASDATPDLLPVHQDFIIEGTAHIVSTQIINGHVSTRDAWTIQLRPKKTGTLIIPSIRIGQQHSKALEIQVTDDALSTPSTSSQLKKPHTAIELQVHAAETAPFINQAIHYTVKLIHRDQLLDSEYQPPELQDALIIPLGQGTHHESIQAGEPIAIEEQHYAIFPQTSGEQTLLSPTLQAVILHYGTPKQVRITRQSTMLHVKPIPATTNRTHWLPAQAVSLTEKYSSPKTKLTAGSTLVRTITLTALDAPAELLPGLTARTPDGVSVYPEKPDLHNSLNGQQLVGKKTFEISYLFKESGKITLPKYSITWFNTRTQTTETVELPQRVVHIVGAPSSAQSISTKSSTTPPTALPATGTQPGVPINLAWGVAMCFALAWLLTLAYYYRRSHVTQSTTQKKKTTRFKHRALRDAILSHDPDRAYAAILQWAKKRWPDAAIQHLEDVIRCVSDDALRTQLAELLAQRYNKSASLWNGTLLWNALQAYRPKPKSKQPTHQVPPINPR